MLNHNDTIRIERVIEGANWQHSKNGFLKSAPHHTFLVSYESGHTYYCIARTTTLTHEEMAEVWMLEVTPQITRAQKKRQGARLVENDNKRAVHGERKLGSPEYSWLSPIMITSIVYTVTHFPANSNRVFNVLNLHSMPASLADSREGWNRLIII